MFFFPEGCLVLCNVEYASLHENLRITALIYRWLVTAPNFIYSYKPKTWKKFRWFLFHLVKVRKLSIASILRQILNELTKTSLSNISKQNNNHIIFYPLSDHHCVSKLVSIRPREWLGVQMWANRDILQCIDFSKQYSTGKINRPDPEESRLVIYNILCDN